MVRSTCCRKLEVKKDLWTDEENLDFACNQGKVSWNGIAKKTGLRRCGKSCRLRWTNYLKPDFSNAGFNLQEEELIIRLHATIGSRWTIIAQQLPGRTDNDVKNYWNSKLRKKLTDMGIDPVTHRPFSQVLADYGSIGGLPKTTNRTASLSKDFKNPVFTKHDQFPYLKTHPGDLLSELQAVKMMADASSLVSQSASSSSSSSSSSASCSTAFSWRDFLQEDVILQTDFLQKEQENGDELPMIVPASEKTGEGGGNQCSRNEEEASLFCHGSRFIEAMVDQDDKMFLDFRDLLEEPF